MDWPRPAQRALLGSPPKFILFGLPTLTKIDVQYDYALSNCLYPGQLGEFGPERVNCEPLTKPIGVSFMQFRISSSMAYTALCLDALFCFG